MKRTSLVLVFLFIGFDSFSQNISKDIMHPFERNKILSLITESRRYVDQQHFNEANAKLQEALVITKEIRNENLQVDVMYEMSTVYRLLRKYNLVLQIDSSGLAIAQKNNYQLGIAKMNNMIATNYVASGKPDKALNLFFQNIPLIKQTNDTAVLITAYNTIGNCYMQLRVGEKGINYFDTCIVLCKKIKDSIFEYNIYSNLGVCYRQKGDYATAADYFIKSIKFLEKNADQSAVVAKKINLALLYSDLKKPDEILRLLYPLLPLLESKQPYTGVVHINSMLGKAHKATGRSDSALTYFNREIFFTGRLKDYSSYSNTYYEIANIFRDRNKYDSALHYYNLATAFIDSGRNSPKEFAKSLICFNMGILYNKQKQYNKAEEFLLKGLNCPLPDKKLVLFQISQFYDEINNPNKASFYRDQYLKIKDSAVSNELLLQIKHAADEYEIEKKQTAIQLSEKQNKIKELELLQSKNEKKIILFVLVAVLLISVIIFLSYLRNKKLSKQLAQRNNRIEFLIRELHHRIKNNLQILSSLLSLQSYSTSDSNTKAVLKEGQTRIDAMSLIHQKLYLTEQSNSIDFGNYLITLSEMLANSFGFDPAVIKINLEDPDKKIDVDIAIPMALIINELITNSFKHAFKEIEDPEIIINLKQEKNKINLTVKDNGIGIDKPKDNSSFGIKLVNTLVKQLKANVQVEHQNGMSYNFEFNIA